MAIRVVRLGSEREPGEGLRIGTVRRPPRGVPKAEFASGSWYDVWLPVLAPSAETVKLGQGALIAATGNDARSSSARWAAFVRTYRAEMTAGDAKHVLELLAALSKQASFSVGCYCEDPSRCHRSVLRELLAERGATIVGGDGHGPAGGPTKRALPSRSRGRLGR